METYSTDFTARQLDLIAEAILAKMKKNRDAADMLTCTLAVNAIEEEIHAYKEILNLITNIEY